MGRACGMHGTQKLLLENHMESTVGEWDKNMRMILDDVRRHC
jgi:hypothetical protein